MIVLLSCSISLLGNDDVSNPSTGVLEEVDDSVQISYNDLRIVNSKLIELNYEKEINKKLRTIISNDSIIHNDDIRIHKVLNKEIKKVTKQRDICFGTTIVAIFLSIFLLVK